MGSAAGAARRGLIQRAPAMLCLGGVTFALPLVLIELLSSFSDLFLSGFSSLVLWTVLVPLVSASLANVAFPLFATELVESRLEQRPWRVARIRRACGKSLLGALPYLLMVTGKLVTTQIPTIRMTLSRVISGPVSSTSAAKLLLWELGALPLWALALLAQAVALDNQPGLWARLARSVRAAPLGMVSSGLGLALLSFFIDNAANALWYMFLVKHVPDQSGNVPWMPLWPLQRLNPMGLVHLASASFCASYFRIAHLQLLRPANKVG